MRILEILNITSVIGTYGLNLFCISLFIIPALLILRNTKIEICICIFFLLVTIISTSYHNYTKMKITDNYKSIINNIYFKKTLNHFFYNLEPKFKKIRHQINIGETFDSILIEY